jgi:glutathione S-transferase
MAGSIVAQAMLEEAGAPYKLHHVDMAGDAHKQQDYLRINPVGRVPALTLPSQDTIGETAAIVITLGEHFPKAKLTPQPGDADREQFLFWLSVMATAGYMTVARHGHPERYAFGEKAISEVEQQAACDLEAFFDKMEAAIVGKDTFLSSGFSALDLYLAMLTEWSADRDKFFENRPSIRAVCRSVGTRPAYKTAMQTHQ